jgi:putative aminopeptidase FrvX
MITAVNFKLEKDQIEWLKKYLRIPSPSGREAEAQKFWLEYIRPFVDSFNVDSYGNVICVINQDAPFKVVIEAHADEIAWYVHRITKDGFLHVLKNGGADPEISPSQKVRIHTKNGEAPGVFGWPAVHTRSGNPKEPTPENMFIDCGCSSREAVEDLGIDVGDCVTYDSHFKVINDKYFVGRGQDNKVGGLIIATIARLLRENEVHLPYSLYVVNAVQEEVGQHGAAMAAHTIRPHCAFVTDVTHATRTPLIDKNREGDIDLAQGPVIMRAPAIHDKLRELMIKTATEEKIPFQRAVSSKKTGTDADGFAYTDGGIPTALLSLPLRYMHTTVETTHKSDIEHSISLLYHVLTRIDPSFNFRQF